MEFLGVIERFVAATFPHASVVVLAGSTSRAQRTATSDIDLLVIGDTVFPDERISLAATYRFEDEVFEVFAYTPEGFATWARRGFEQYRPVIVQMLMDGITVRGAEERERHRQDWSDQYAAGPTPVPSEFAIRRYVITDVLDDLRDSTDELERTVLASLLFEKTAELVLLTNKRWIGAGKYLPRRLREFDRTRAEALARPFLERNYDTFADRVEQELVHVGGRLQEGFER